MTTTSDDKDNRYALTIPGACHRLGGMSRSRVYQLVGEGELEMVKAGRRSLVLVASIDRYLASLPAAVIKAPKPRVRQ